MMGPKWFICVTVLVLVKHIAAKKAPVRTGRTQALIGLPLLKPLGMTKTKFSENLEDRRLGQDYIEQYQEMLKASQESFENFDERVRDQKRLRRLIGDDDLGLMAEAGGLPRRRSAGKLQSAAGKRRARSQSIRREKLNAQGVISHKLHTKQTNLEYIDD